MGLLISGNNISYSPVISCAPAGTSHSPVNSNLIVVEKNDQSSFKGLLWKRAATVSTDWAAGLSLGTAIGAGLTLLQTIESGAPHPGLLTFTATGFVASTLAVKFAGYCHTNTNYHFGPKFEIIKA